MSTIQEAAAERRQREAEAERRKRRGTSSPSDDYDPQLRRVMTIAEFCERNGLSKPTFIRMRAAGIGPAIVQLAVRRIGITYAAELAWQDSRLLSE
jgi:predicted DNA-binding transcriptional regulator AlpA